MTWSISNSSVCSNKIRNKEFFLIKKAGNILLIIILLVISTAANAFDSTEPVWHERNLNDQPVIHLYFFWSKNCPHCLKAQPDIIEINNKYSWLKLHSLELSDHPENIQAFRNMTEMFEDESRSVPTFIFCGNLVSGYDDKNTTGQLLISKLFACYQFVKSNSSDNTALPDLNGNKEISVEVPFIGGVSSADFSLPVLTVLIAGMDAFNPCAFFVLLFLLSMMVHSRSRGRMVLIGGIFVFFSGAVYFLFMSAWLNLFIYLGELRVMTLIAGSVAVIVASINIKDFFWFKKGFSLSIADNKKPKLIDRIQQLLRLDSIITVVFSTVVLALVANSYELLCTAGFPMVYTRILTLHSLSTESYYLYLLLYNLIYILPLLIIVILFTIKLGSRKLSEFEGMVLKLLSGVMMLMLGVLLLVAPHLLSNVIVAFALILIAISVTWSIVKVTGR